MQSLADHLSPPPIQATPWFDLYPDYEETISALLYYIPLPLRIKIPPYFSGSSAERIRIFIELSQENWPFPFFLSTIIRLLNALA
jgi:hypothetical protein